MDAKDRALLDNYGLVRHAALESPDHKLVHVIYNHHRRKFVEEELTEELKKRTGLQQVSTSRLLPLTSSSTTCTHTIVITGWRSGREDKLLRHAVKTTPTERPTVYMLRDDDYPDWVEDRLTPSNHVVYPQSQDTSRVSTFWDCVTSLLGQFMNSNLSGLVT